MERYKDHINLSADYLREILGMEGDFTRVYVDDNNYVHIISEAKGAFKNSVLVLLGGYVEERLPRSFTTVELTKEESDTGSIKGWDRRVEEADRVIDFYGKVIKDRLGRMTEPPTPLPAQFLFQDR